MKNNALWRTGITEENTRGKDWENADNGDGKVFKAYSITCAAGKAAIIGGTDPKK
jgi:hypothetical protein